MTTEQMRIQNGLVSTSNYKLTTETLETTFEEGDWIVKLEVVFEYKYYDNYSVTNFKCTDTITGEDITLEYNDKEITPYITNLIEEYFEECQNEDY